MRTEAAARRVCSRCHALFRGDLIRCPRDGGRLEPARCDPLIGRTLAGRYVIEEVLGEGGMGRVYRAHHRRMGRRFAIKVLHGEHATHDKMVIRFQREADAVGRLTHPNVVNIVDFGESKEGLRYLVMDYVEGLTLREVIRRRAPVPAGRALALIAQLCEGLAHAHSRGLIHRDLKPDNILIESGEGGDVVRIADFGLAVAHDATTFDEEQRLTTQGLVLGTPHYMAPEQATGQTIDHRTDLYAVGVILYELLAGASPFEGPPVVVAQLHAFTEPPPIAERVPGVVVDPLVEALMMRLMAKRREDRVQSAREVVRLIRLIQTDRVGAMAELGVAPPPSPVWPIELAPTERPLPVVTGVVKPASPPIPSTMRTRQRRSRWPVVASMVGAMLLIAAEGRVIGRNRDDRPVEPAASPVVRSTISEMIADMAPPAAPPVEPARTVAVPVAADHGRPARPSARPMRRLVSSPARRAGETAATAALGKQYRVVGAKLDQLIAKRGATATARLKERYRNLPVAGALHNPAVARDVNQRLAVLSGDIDRALR